MSLLTEPEVGLVRDARDVVVAGAVRVRLVDAGPADRAAVEAQLGPTSPTVGGQADITVRYVPHLPVPDGMRLMGPGEVGAGDGAALIVLRGRYRTPARVRIPLGDLGGPCQITCEHGVGRVPHLIAVVNLALLTHDTVALHASAVELDGRAIVATGWSKGGKTEVVLSLLDRGARLVGDEWLHLRPDGTVTGIHEPLRVWDWQLAQLPATRAAVGRRHRSRLAVLGAASRLAARRSPRLATVIDRQRFVDMEGVDVSPQRPSDTPIPLGTVALVTSAERDDIRVLPMTGTEIADRMVASLAYERSPLHELADAHRFAFPGTPLPALDAAAERERALLGARLADLPAIEVVHPYPVELAGLGDAILGAVQEAP